MLSRVRVSTTGFINSLPLPVRAPCKAIIAESVTPGAGHIAASPALLAASPEMPMPNLDQITQPDPAGVGGGAKSK
jgi:hypothetical protein